MFLDEKDFGVLFAIQSYFFSKCAGFEVATLWFLLLTIVGF